MRIGFWNRTPSLKASVVLSLALILGAVAKDKTSGSATVQGKVFLIDREHSTIMVDTKTGVRRLVAYSAGTEFKYGRNDKGRESSADDLKESDSISCTGTIDDRARLIAKDCIYRE